MCGERTGSQNAGQPIRGEWAHALNAGPTGSGAGLTETGFYSSECRATGASWASKRAGNVARLVNLALLILMANGITKKP